MSILLLILFSFLCFFVFSFLVWRRLKEDYTSETIFSFQFWFLFAFLSAIAFGFYLHTAFFWFSLFFTLLATIFVSRRKRMRFFEVIDACVMPVFVLLFLISFYLFFSSRFDLSYLVLGVISLFSVILAALFFKYYRHFSWYPSGKTGFASLATFFVFILLFTTVALLLPNMLSFQRKLFDALAGFGISVVLIIALYKRSERVIQKDLEVLLNKIKFKKNE